MAVSRKHFEEAYCARVQDLRIGRGWTQERMAAALDIPVARYKKYETRTPLPPHLIGPFAREVGKDVADVLGVQQTSGRGPRPAKAAAPKPTPAEADRRKGGQ